MSYVICKEPGTQIDLMFKKEYMPKVVGYIEQAKCSYKKEIDRVVKGIDEEWVTLKDISAENGRLLGHLLGLYMSLDWEALTRGSEDKFYILIHKARGKKHGSKNRKKADPGRESGAGEGSAEAVRHGERIGADRGNPDGGADRDGDIRPEQAE